MFKMKIKMVKWRTKRGKTYNFWQLKLAFLTISCYTLTINKFALILEISYGWD